MTWEWVVLILGVLFLLFTFGIMSMYFRREIFEQRAGSIFAPSVTRRTGLNLQEKEE